MSRRSKEFMPHTHVRCAGLEVIGVRVDGRDIPLEEVADQEHRVLSLAHEVEGDAELELDVRIRFPDRAHRTLHEGETFAADSRVVVSLCSHSAGSSALWSRTPFGLEVHEGAYEGTVRFRALDVSPLLIIEGSACRRAPREPHAALASDLGSLLVSLLPWTVRLEEPRTTPGGLLDVRWTEFGLRFRHRSTLPYHLEIDCNPPILWLNSGLDEFKTLLHGKGRRGTAARMRELINRSIAASVWLQLAFAALFSVPSSGSDQDEWAVEWHKRVAAQIAMRVYPGLSAPDRLAALRDEARRATEHGALAPFIAELADASLDESQFSGAIEGAIRELQTT